MDITVNRDIDFFNYDGTGYHGHKTNVIENILANDSFELSTKDWSWAGDGVYFFDNDLELAIRWCERARNYDDYGIIKSDIRSEKVIDMDNNSHYNIIEDLARQIYERYKRISNEKELTTRLLFNFIHNNISFDLIKFTKEVPHGGRVIRTPLVRNQVILCVKNQECILLIEEVDIDDT